MAVIENSYNSIQEPDLSQYGTQEEKMAALRRWKENVAGYEQSTDNPSYWQLGPNNRSLNQQKYASYNEMVAGLGKEFGNNTRGINLALSNASLYEPWKQDVNKINNQYNDDYFKTALNRYGQQQSVRQNNPNQNARTTAMKQYLSGAVY